MIQKLKCCFRKPYLLNLGQILTVAVCFLDMFHFFVVVVQKVGGGGGGVGGGAK